MGKRAHYTALHIEGFKSFAKPVTIPLDRVGINLVKGKNGVGKSTIINSLLWCEYGMNLTETIPTWDDIRPATWRGTRVIVDRTDGEFTYRIARHIGFKGTTCGIEGGDRLMIFKKPVTDTAKFTDAHLLGEGRSKPEQQKIIEEQLGVNGDTFLNSIVFGQNVMSLVTADNNYKRQLFEILFDVGFVEEAKERAKTKQTDKINEQAVLSGKVESNNRAIITWGNTITQNAQLLKDWNEGQQQKITDVSAKMEEVKAQHKTEKGKVEQLVANLSKYDRTRYDNIKKELEDRREEVRQIIEGKRSAWTVTQSEYRSKVEGIRSDFENKKREKKVLSATASGILSELTISLDGGKRNLGRYNDQVRNSNQRIEKFKADIENVSTICPTCGGKIKADKLKEAKDNINDQITAEEKVIGVVKENITSIEQLIKEKEEAIQAKQLEVTALEQELSAIDGERDNAIHAAQQLHNTAQEAHETDIRYYQNDGKTLNLEEEVQQLYEGLSGLFQLEKDIEVGKNICLNLTNNFNNLKADKTRLEEEQAPKIDIEGYKQKIDVAEQENLGYASQLEQIKTDLEHIDWWIKKGFGAAGLKAFVFNAMLSKLNIYAANYESKLGFRVELSLDMKKASRPFQTLVYKSDKVRNYKDLSGGQRKRADLGLAFALHDVVSDKIDINIMYLDEVTDALDNEGVEIFFELVASKAESKSIFLITHNDVINGPQMKEIYLDLDEGQNTYIAA